MLKFVADYMINKKTQFILPLNMKLLIKDFKRRYIYNIAREGALKRWSEWQDEARFQRAMRFQVK